jgi:2-polyprenyl-3-methyl-5-hydroxy-6-metoxy-1,4-benzoquinol methylase
LIQTTATSPTVVTSSQDLCFAYDTTYYTESCDGYESFARYQGQRLVDDRLVGMATLTYLKPAGRVLDLGCGRGELAFHLAQRGFRVTAIDYSETAIRLAETCFAQQPERWQQIEFICADVGQVQLPKGAYDMAIASDVIEHLTPAEVLHLYAQVKIWLKPDGLFIIHTFPNRWYYDYDYARKRRLAQQLGTDLPPDPRTDYERLMHINEQSPRQLKRQLQATFEHVCMWFAMPGAGLGGSLLRSFSHREMAAAPSLYAIASAQSIPDASLQSLLQSQPQFEPASSSHPKAGLSPFAGNPFHLAIAQSPSRVLSGQPFELQVSLTNYSPDILHSFGDYPIHWSYHWFDPQGHMIIDEGDRTRIFPPSLPQLLTTQPQPQDLHVRSTLHYVDVTAPKQPGDYILQITLVQERVRWLDQPPFNCLRQLPIVVSEHAESV